MTPQETLEKLREALINCYCPQTSFLLQDSIKFWENEVKKVNETNVYNFTVL